MMPITELEPTPPDVKRYQRHKLTAVLAAAIVGLAWLFVLAAFIGPRLGQWLTEHLGHHEWLRLLAAAIVLGVGLEMLTLPIDFWSSFVLEHRHQLSNQSFGAWLKRRLKGYLVGGLMGMLLVAGLYAIVWLTGEYWWLCAAAGWLLATLVLGQLVPVLILPLFYKVTRLDDPDLLDKLRHLADGTGLTLAGVYRLHLSAETRKANAALTGLGRTRRVLLGDTLLDQFTSEEIEVVFAHEVGHHVHRHLAKMIAVNVTVAGVGFWLVDLVLGAWALGLGYAGIGDPSALPLVLLVLALFGLIVAPAQNALSRFFEVQCDRYALERTGLDSAYRSAFLKLARINKSDPDPNPIVAWLFYDHPPIRQRLALAK